MSSLATQSTPQHESRVEPPLRKERSLIPKWVLANVMVHTDLTHCNEIILNERSFKQLFPQEVYSPEEPRYVSIAQNVLMVNQQCWDEENYWAGINSYDYETARLDDHVSIENSTKKLMIAVFNPKCAPSVRLKSIQFAISVYNPRVSGHSSDCVIPAANVDVAKLKEKLHELLDNHFLKIGLTLHIECEGVLCRIIVIDNLTEMEGTQSSSVHHGMLTAETEIGLQMENKGNINRILLVSQIPAQRVQSLRFEIETDEQSWTSHNHDEPWYGQEDFLPLALPLSQIRKEISEKFKVQGIVLGHSVTLHFGGHWSYSIKLKQAELHEEYDDTDILTKRYEIPSEASIELTPKKNIRLLKDKQETVPAASIKFTVLRAEPVAADESCYPYINVGQLESAIRQRAERHLMFNGARFNVHLTTGTYHVELYKGFGADPSSQTETLESPWKITEETKLEFSIDHTLTEKLIDSDKPYPLTQIVFTAELRQKKRDEPLKSGGVQKDATIFIPESELLELVNSNMPKHLFKNQTFEVTHEKGYTIRLGVKELITDSKENTEAIYGRVTERTAQTQIKFQIPVNNKLSLLSRKLPLSYKNVKEKMASMKLGGMRKQMDQIMRSILTSRGPAKKLREALGFKPPKGILLYGLPGNGKTTFARQIGELLGCENDRLKMIAGSELLNMYVGETEKDLRELIEPADRAFAEYGEESELYVIVIDEIDTIVPSRDNSERHHTKTMVNQFLSVLDGLKELTNVLFIGTTNRRDLMDSAALRPGRFDTQVEIVSADEEGRKEIFEIHLQSILENNLLAEDVDLSQLAINTAEFTGADIEGLVRLAASYFLERVLKKHEDDDILDLEAIKADSSERIQVADFDRAFTELKGLQNIKAPNESFTTS